MQRVELPDLVARPVGDGGFIRALAGASVQVNHRSGAPATVWSAETAGVELPNPLTSDAAGHVEGWVDEGPYTLVVSGNEIDTYPFYFEAVSASGLHSRAFVPVATPGVVVVDAGEIGDVYIADTEDQAEIWILATLTDDATIYVPDIAEGKQAWLSVTQDGVGGHTLTISDGAVSTDVEVDPDAGATTDLTLRSPDGESLVIDGGSSHRPARDITGDYSPTAGDVDRLLIGRAAAPALLALPTDAEQSIEVGTEIPLLNNDTGVLRVGAHAGAVLHSLTPGDRALVQHARGVACKTGPDEWLVSGELSPVTTLDLTDLSALSLLLEADQVSGVDFGDEIPTWNDRSGLVHHAIASSGHRPILIEGGHNGYPTVRFDGATTRFDIAAIQANAAQRTILAVAARRGGAGNQCVWCLKDTGSFLRSNADWRYASNEAGADVVIGGVDTELSLLTVRFNGAGSAEVFLNGAGMIEFNPKDGYGASPSGSSLSIGAISSGVQFWNGDLSALIVCDAALSDGDLADLHPALMAKWGITA